MRCNAVSEITGDFSAVIDKFSKDSVDKAELSIRKIAIEVFRRVIMQTPVRSGRARGNWQASIGSPALGEFESLDKDGNATIQKMIAEVARWKPEDNLPAFITNNLPYIQRLNDGWSKQAPSHFIEKVIADLGGIAKVAEQ